MTLVFFDLDDTLLAGDTEAAWADYMSENNLISDNSFHKKIAEFESQYREGKLNVVRYTQLLLSPIAGMKIEEVNILVKPFAKRIVDDYKDQLTDDLIKRHANDECLITSGTLTFLVKEIAFILGIKVFFGTDPEILNGVYTGNLNGNPNFEEEKVIKIKKWLGLREVNETVAYSDSVHDLPLLSYAKNSTVINPDKELRKIASSRGWVIDDSRLEI